MINISSNENLDNSLELEIISLNSNLTIQKNYNKQILIFMKKLVSNINISIDKDPDLNSTLYLSESAKILNLSNSNINLINNLLDTLNSLSTSNENFTNDIKIYNDNYKKNFSSIHTNTELIDKFLYNLNTNEFTANNQVKLIAEPITTIDSCTNMITPNMDLTNNVNSKFLENTLIISESQKKVILPFTIDKLQEILNNSNRFKTFEEIIDKFYTKPLNYYRYSPIARFKEAYKLVVKKEKGSKFKAISLALELFGNYSLHPAIISACNSLDELDIYLACLDENDLDDFKFFDIKYEVPLAISKLANSNL